MPTLYDMIYYITKDYEIDKGIGMQDIDNKYNITKVNYINDFRCDSSKCYENCCSKYIDIGVDDRTVELYKSEKPELLKFIKREGSAQYNYALDVTEEKQCAHFAEGKCNIHIQYGEDYLPEVCWFYPRVYKKLNNKIFLTIALACSEVIRLVLFGKENFTWGDYSVKRVSEVIYDFAPLELENKDIELYLDFHSNILKWLNNSHETAGQILLKLLAVAKILDQYDRGTWVKEATLMAQIKEAFDTKYNYDDCNTPDKSLAQEYIDSLTELTTWYKNDSLSETIENIKTFANDEKFSEKYKEIFNSYINTPDINLMFTRYLKAKICESIFPSCYWWNSVCKDELLYIIHNYIAIQLALITHIYRTNNIPSEDEVVRYFLDIEGYFYGRYDELEDKYNKLGFDDDKKITMLLSSFSN